MRARSLLPAFALGLALLVTAPALAEEDDDRRERGRSGGARVQVGDFEIGAHTVEGEHVSFRFNESGIYGFTANDVLLFDLVSGRPASPRDLDVEQRGALVELTTDAFKLRAHDNPTGATKIVVPDGNATLSLAPNGRVVLDAGGARFTVGGLSGTIRGNDLRISGQNVTATDELLVFLQVSRADVDAHRADIGRAIVKRHVGAEASYGLSAEKVKEEVVSYGNVTVTTVKAGKGNLTVQIEGHGTEGRVLVFNVDGRVLGASKAGDLHILLDNESVKAAADLSDVLDPDDDGFTPESYVVFDPNVGSFQLIVTVPHYSVHTLTVNVLELVRPSVVVGIVAGVLLLVPSALVLFRRK